MSELEARPEPLLPTDISLVLEYIAPPSLLSTLPPHLISNSLTQRHRFLHLSPDTPADYLAWPTDSQPNAQQNAIDLLEDFQKPLDDHVYPVRYTSDAESAFAHVDISSSVDPPGLRLVFQWNPPDGWKFHNLAFMPFPTNSYESVKDIVVYEPHDFLVEPPMAPVDDVERDSYWDAYGLSESDDLQDQSGFNKPNVDLEAGTEDAYWAQYSAVHGSGDSTRPTPPTVNQKLAEDRVIIAYPGHRTSSAYNPLRPPSPSTLAFRLANISPRVASPPFVDDSDSGSGSGSDSGGSSSSPTASPPSHTSMFSSSLLSIDTHTSASDISFDISPVVEQPLGVNNESRDALKDTIRSVFRLWHAGRVISSPTLNGDKEEFLNVVRQVIAESSL
ncbi:hypothetical protein D9615_010670 [Tricholomella constricta]|uniref:Uncharacterized protein n=1 Tax=Tricholomella constricta TaxID=117010 RepID=A0A8H5GLG0_9AGAR|nr:hypothetical protein D9615_010670 [Tricholomella constricta]